MKYHYDHIIIELQDFVCVCVCFIIQQDFNDVIMRKNKVT